MASSIVQTVVIASPESLTGISTMVLTFVTALAALLAFLQLKAFRKANASDQLRRRGEATMDATERFIKTYSKHHAILLKLARAESRTVKEIVASNSKGEPMEALQEQLDALEFLSLGARLGIFDVNVIEYMVRSVIMQLWDRSTSYRSDLINGRQDTRPAQPTAYEHSKWLHDELEKKQTQGFALLDGTLPQIK